VGINDSLVKTLGLASGGHVERQGISANHQAREQDHHGEAQDAARGMRLGPL
jgi:hypothetical protein